MTEIGPIYASKLGGEWGGKVMIRLRAMIAPRKPVVVPIPASGTELPGGPVSIEELKARGNALQVRLDAARALLQAYEL